MVTEPIRYVKEFAKCGADIITVHLEACEDVKATVDEIKGKRSESRHHDQTGNSCERIDPVSGACGYVSHHER